MQFAFRAAACIAAFPLLLFSAAAQSPSNPPNVVLTRISVLTTYS
jgi:hypothetical protein